MHVTINRIELDKGVRPDCSPCDCPPTTNWPTPAWRAPAAPADRPGPRVPPRMRRCGATPGRHGHGQHDVQTLNPAVPQRCPNAVLTSMASAQAAAAPAGTRAAAAGAARSAAAWARWRATTAPPMCTPATATATTAVIRTAPKTVAAPYSSLTGLDRGDGFGGDEHPGSSGERPPTRATTNPPSRRRSPMRPRRHGAGGGLRRTGVAARGQSRDLAGRIDATHLHRHRGDTGQAQHDHHHQCRDRQSGLDGAEPGVTGYTLVLSARLMMLVSAPTIESPVTTL